MFGGLECGEVYLSVYVSLGLVVWVLIVIDILCVYIYL